MRPLPGGRQRTAATVKIIDRRLRTLEDRFGPADGKPRRRPSSDDRHGWRQPLIADLKRLEWRASRAEAMALHIELSRDKMIKLFSA